MEFARKDIIDFFTLQSENFKDASQDNIRSIVGNVLKIGELNF
jgi:hypothetical protein